MPTERLQITEPEKLVDQTAEKVVELLGETPPGRSIRKSQVASVFLGAIGFAVFVAGIEQVISNIPSGISIFVGLLVMALSGALIQNLSR